MWHCNNDQFVKYDDIHLEYEILLSWKRVFFLDGPTRCGKTHFLNHMFSSNVIVSPYCIVQETLYDFLNKKKALESFYEEIDRNFPCRILAFEDIDISLVGRDATQTEIAVLFNRLIKERKLILTGIDIDRRCMRLLSSLGSDKFEYFRYIK